jgi:hypothetical protein
LEKGDDRNKYQAGQAIAPQQRLPTPRAMGWLSSLGSVFEK